MLTEEVYTVLERIDSLTNEVFYRTCQLRDLGELVIGANTSIDASQMGCYIKDYCVPSVTDLNSLEEAVGTLKSFLEVQP